MKTKTKQEILAYIDAFDVQKYAKSRNHVGGSVSMLSPYITHGIVTIPELVDRILSYSDIKSAEKFLMELVWKEFFMQAQKSHGNDFLTAPVREDKTGIPKKSLLPRSLINWTTQTARVNETIQELNATWWLHNHKRMRLASRCCHRAKLDWKKCADWTYYHFIDGELAPNHLSRQWVNSTFANKPYFMNEENLQKYWSWTSDPDLRWTYDAVFEKLFDGGRNSLYREEADKYTKLTTPIEYIKKRNKDILSKKWWSIYILSPWKLDKTICFENSKVVIVLDVVFTRLHPRSQKRLDFVQKYADTYNILFCLWEYGNIINECLQADYSVILDERRDPTYREAQDVYKKNDNVSILSYSLLYKQQNDEVILKFFKYWNEVKKVLKKNF